MKLLRTLIALVLAASVSITGLAAAGASPQASHSLGSNQRNLSHLRISGETPATATVGPAVPVTLSTTPTAPADTGRVIVHFKGSATPAVLSAVAKSAETSAGTVRQVVRGQFTWRTPKGRSAEQFAARLQKSSKVEYAVPDYIRQPVAYTPPAYPSLAGPNDPAFQSSATGTSYYFTATGKKVYVAKYPNGASWWLREIEAPTAWAQGYTGPNIVGKYPLRADGTQVTVAVLDSGLYPHPDNSANVVGGHDFFYNDSDVTPVAPITMPSSQPWGTRVLTASHGTCVSGEIAATANNSLGTVGVGYDTRVVVDKVMGTVASDGSVGIPDDVVISAIKSEADAGTKVINMSFGGYQYSQAIVDAVDYAYSKGCILVAAKGNDASGRAFYPASNAHVISVGALDKNASEVTIPASYTNYAKTPLDVMAPGGFIWGLDDPNQDLVPGLTQYGYYLWDGTSMAAPVVAGAVAWLWRAAPALSNAEITSEVLSSAHKGPKSKHFPSGYRELDMAAAYARLEADYPLLTKPDMHDQTVAAVGPDVGLPLTWGVPLGKLRGVTYDYTFDGSQTFTTPESFFHLALNNPGDHLITVTAHSSYNWDDGTATNQETVHLVPAVDGTSTWDGAYVAGSRATAASPQYGAATAIDATLKDASGTPLATGVSSKVELQASSDGITFSDVASETNLPNGLYRAAVAPVSRTWYRAAFSGYGGITASISSPVVVIPGVSLSTPSAKSSISHTKKLAVSGKLMPSHASSSRTVKLKLKRWNGHRWADYSSTWTRVTWRSRNFSTYSAKVKLKKGAYRLYAYAPADAQHSATTSGFKAVTVK